MKRLAEQLADGARQRRLAWLREQRERRKLYAERSRNGQCLACGGDEWVDAIDNHGQPYKGCARCVIRLT